MSQKKALKENPTEPAVVYILSRKDEDIRNLNAEGVAAAIQTNLDQLTPVFEKDQKISIPDFIEREKMHRAYFILHKGIDAAIPELSKRFGFASTAEFEKKFEEYVCVKPGKYKEFAKKRITRESAPAQTKPGNINEQL